MQIRANKYVPGTSGLPPTFCRVPISAHGHEFACTVNMACLALSSAILAFVCYASRLCPPISLPTESLVLPLSQSLVLPAISGLVRPSRASSQHRATSQSATNTTCLPVCFVAPTSRPVQITRRPSRAPRSCTPRRELAQLGNLTADCQCQAAREGQGREGASQCYAVQRAAVIPACTYPVLVSCAAANGGIDAQERR